MWEKELSSLTMLVGALALLVAHISPTQEQYMCDPEVGTSEWMQSPKRRASWKDMQRAQGWRPLTGDRGARLSVPKYWVLAPFLLVIVTMIMTHIRDKMGDMYPTDMESVVRRKTPRGGGQEAALPKGNRSSLQIGQPGQQKMQHWLGHSCAMVASVFCTEQHD